MNIYNLTPLGARRGWEGLGGPGRRRGGILRPMRRPHGHDVRLRGAVQASGQLVLQGVRAAERGALLFGYISNMNFFHRHYSSFFSIIGPIFFCYFFTPLHSVLISGRGFWTPKPGVGYRSPHHSQLINVIVERMASRGPGPAGVLSLLTALWLSFFAEIDPIIMITLSL